MIHLEYKENDKEILSLYSKNSVINKEEYKLGSTFSGYTKLGNTNYYFKFM